MRHLKKGRKLKRTSSERKALLRGLARSLVLHGHIRTTEAKAKALRPFAERLVSRAKDQSLANRRYLLRFLDQESTRKIFEIAAQKYLKRHGGYTRIIKIGRRQGDNAPLVQIELV